MIDRPNQRGDQQVLVWLRFCTANCIGKLVESATLPQWSGQGFEPHSPEVRGGYYMFVPILECVLDFQCRQNICVLIRTIKQ